MGISPSSVTPGLHALWIWTSSSPADLPGGEIRASGSKEAPTRGSNFHTVGPPTSPASTLSRSLGRRAWESQRALLARWGALHPTAVVEDTPRGF